MPSTRVYSRSPYILPQQGDDIFEPVYNQPSQMVPVEYGSAAGGQAVLQGQSYANPGYEPSRLDRYAGDEKGYGNGALGYEDGLQLDQEGIGQYYDTVNRLNDLSLKAENLGFNIKKPDFRNKLQQQMFTEYQQNLQDAQTRVMTLKRGRELQNEVQKGIIEGKVYTPNNQHFRNQGTFTDADFANSTNTVADQTSEAFNKYNAKTYNDPAAEALARKRRTGLVGEEQKIIDQSDAVLADPNATFEQRDKAINDKFKAEQDQLQYAQPTLDRNEILNREAKKREAAAKDAPILTVSPTGNTTTSKAILQHTVTANNPTGTAKDLIAHHSLWADIADKNGKTIKVFANPASYLNNTTGLSEKGSPNGFTGEIVKIYNAALSENGAEYKHSGDTRNAEGEAKYLRETAAMGAKHELVARLRVVDAVKIDKDMATMEPTRQKAIEADIQAAASSYGITAEQAKKNKEIMTPIYAKHRLDPAKYINEVSVPLKDIAGQIQANGGGDVSQLYNTPQFKAAQAIFDGGKPTERQTSALAAFQKKLGRAPSATEREKILTKFK